MANQTVQWYGGELIGFSRARHWGRHTRRRSCVAHALINPTHSNYVRELFHMCRLICGNRIGGLDYFVAIPFRHNLDAFRRIITPPLGIPPNARSTLQNCWNSDSVNLMAFESAFRTFSDELMY